MKKKNTIRVSKKDIGKLLADNEHMTKQITELQTRMTELMEENRTLHILVDEQAATIDERDALLAKTKVIWPSPPPEPSKPFDIMRDYIDPNMIYFDDANGLRNR